MKRAPDPADPIGQRLLRQRDMWREALKAARNEQVTAGRRLKRLDVEIRQHNQSQRQNEILNWIVDHPNCTVKELHAKFAEWSAAVLQLDLDHLREAGKVRRAHKPGTSALVYSAT